MLPAPGKAAHFLQERLERPPIAVLSAIFTNQASTFSLYGSVAGQKDFKKIASRHLILKPNHAGPAPGLLHPPVNRLHFIEN
jgi:hypothetical protein